MARNLLSLVDECQDCFSYYEDCVSNKCAHKSLFPMNGTQISGTIIIFLGYMLCAAGGIGGGPVSLPILVLLYNFRVGQAAPLANFLICAGLLFRYILNSKKKHPMIPSRIRVDYSTVQLALPPAFLGTNVGVILNSTLAPIVALALVVIIFTASAIITLKKGITLYKAESKLKNKKKHQTHQRDESQVGKDLTAAKQIHVQEVYTLQAQAIMKAEKSHCQWKKMLIPWLHFLFLILCAALQAPSKGRSSPFSVVDQCSPGSWILRVVFYLGSLVAIGINSICVKRDNSKKVEAKYPFDAQDIQFSEKKTLICFNLFFFIVMGLSSAFGIGGGFIIVLFFYSYRMHPQVASETMIVILFYVLLASSIQFAIEDRVPWFYALWNAIYAIIGTFTGVVVIQKVIKRTGRASVVVILVACLVALATILIPVTQVMRFDQISPYSFESFC